nr:2TM domain-containing protein [uncultured Flavobacterium sp.]
MEIVMEKQYTEEERYYKARKRVEEIKGFYGNLVSFIVVNIFLMVLNLTTSPNHLWFFWPLLWWGIGVVFHGLKVFNYMPFFSKDWEEKKIKEFMEKEEQTKNTWK